MKKNAVKKQSRSTHKIMLVEKNRVSRKKTLELLTAKGYQVFTANNGFDALSKTIDYQPDLIFIDTKLTDDLDGFQTCKLIKSNNAFDKTPIILMYNKATDFDIGKSKASGAIQKIDKPLDESKLLAQISNHLNV